MRRGRRDFVSGGSAKMSSPCGTVDFPSFNCLCFSSSFDRDERCPTRPFFAFAKGGIFSGRSGRVEFGGAIAERKLSPLGLSSRDKLFYRDSVSKFKCFPKLRGLDRKGVIDRDIQKVLQHSRTTASVQPCLTFL